MSHNHPNPACQAIDVIQQEFRDLRMQVAKLRKQVQQEQAANTILSEKNRDLERQVTQLRAHCMRKLVACGLDVTAIVEVSS